MSTRTVSQFSPLRGGKSTERLVQRVKLPSPEKKALIHTTVISSSRSSASAMESGSPSKRTKSRDGRDREPGSSSLAEAGSCLTDFAIDTRFEVDFVRGSQGLKKGLATSKRIEMDFSLVHDGEALMLTDEQIHELGKLFPTTIAVACFPPYLVFRVQELPPKPWPLTVAGLPVQFSTEKYKDGLDRGKGGRGTTILHEYDLRRRDYFSMKILEEAIHGFDQLQIKIKDIFWWGGCWQVTVPNGANIDALPGRIGLTSPAFYRHEADVSLPDPAALRTKPPSGVDYDDSNYATSPTALLRPGIMLSSSLFKVDVNGRSEEQFKSTSSGVVVTNEKGDFFITVATHGFTDDGLVYHPNPKTGSVIGKVIDTLTGTDISIVRLNPGLRYLNELFRAESGSYIALIRNISPGVPPHLRQYDPLFMNNPFSGFSEGNALAQGGVIVDLPDKRFVQHEWIHLENGTEPVAGSCGSPIVNDDGALVGFFRFMQPDSNLCLAVSGIELEKHGYHIYTGEAVFS